MNAIPSIHDVAREAGVSIATVSRVINGRTRVAVETKRRVERAMRHLSYHPNTRGRALSLKRTDTLGLVLPDLYGDYFGNLMRGVDERAREAGLHLMVTRAQDPEDERDAVERLLGGGRVDGLILMIAEADDQVLDTLINIGGPLVVLDKDVGHRHLDNILVDNRTGARDAAHHLIAVHGLADLLFLGGPEGNIDTRDRARGFADALEAAGLTPRPEQFVYTAYDYDSGRRASDELRRRAPSGRWGLVAANDDLARGAADALMHEGLRVPEDMAVVGYDDSRLAQLSRPALSSVHVPLREVGRHAVEMLLDRLAGHRTQPAKLICKGRLVARSSCGCAWTEGDS